MAILDLVLYPDDPLTQVAEPYDDVGPETEGLARDMLETMHFYEGVGLAGPQVGLAKRIFVYMDPESGAEFCLINPEILASEGLERGEEGCLSLPRVYAEVPRASWVRVRGLTAAGKLREFDAEGYIARIIQHELDHLNGVIFLDRLDILTRQDKCREWEAIRKRLDAARLKPAGGPSHA